MKIKNTNKPKLEQKYKKFNLSPEEARKAWAERLRMGKVRQGKGYLKFYDSKDKHTKRCCLGVACELFNELEPRYKMHTVIAGSSTSFDGSKVLLPVVVAEWLGLTSIAGYLKNSVGYNGTVGYAYACTLPEVNDRAGLSFKEIANIIESGRLHVKE